MKAKQINNFTFLDVETTGGSPNTDRITEIGIVRVENGKKVSEFQSLVNPQIHIPHYIQQLTGINQEMVKRAPLFEDIKQTVHEHLKDSIFVAHNVNFDYSFIRSEFKRSADNYKSKVLCTVRLSRALYPEYKKHSLTDIINRFGLTVENRHRAFDDASALWEFFVLAEKQMGIEKFNETIANIIKGPRLPSYLKRKGIGPFPETPGVYTFIGDTIGILDRQELYIGKSTSLKKRIYSHFTVGSQSKTDITLARYTKDIKTTDSAGGFSASLLEAHLIKDRKPLLNKSLRKTSQYSHAIKDLKNGYNVVKIKSDEGLIPNSDTEIMASFSSARAMKEQLTYLCDTYYLCPTLLKLTNSSPCFSYQVDKCRGACINKETPLTYNMRFVEAFSATKVPPWMFSGPILFEENSEVLSEYHIFNNWCHLSTIREYGNGNSRTATNYPVVFDWDIYKLIKKIITTQSKRITILKNEDIKNYLALDTSFD